MLYFHLCTRLDARHAKLQKLSFSLSPEKMPTIHMTKNAIYLHTLIMAFSQVEFSEFTSDTPRLAYDTPRLAYDTPRLAYDTPRLASDKPN